MFYLIEECSHETVDWIRNSEKSMKLSPRDHAEALYYHIAGDAIGCAGRPFGFVSRVLNGRAGMTGRECSFHAKRGGGSIQRHARTSVAAKSHGRGECVGGAIREIEPRLAMRSIREKADVLRRQFQCRQPDINDKQHFIALTANAEMRSSFSRRQ